MSAESRAVWLTLVLLMAVLAGVGVGVLSWLGGFNPPLSILAGLGATGTAVPVGLAVLHFASGGRP